MSKTRRAQTQRQAASTSKQLDASGYCYMLGSNKIIFMFGNNHGVSVPSATDRGRFAGDAESRGSDWRGIHVRGVRCGTVSK